MKFRLCAALTLSTVIMFTIVCDNSPTRHGSLPDLTSDIISLDVGKSQLLGWESLEIGFDSVLIDDRCILGSPDNCFYGHASTRFWLHMPDADTIWLDFDIYTGDSLWGTGSLYSLDTAGLLLTFVSLDPHPRWEEIHTYDEYSAGLVITDNFADDSSGASVIPTNMSNLFVRMDEYHADSAWIADDSVGIRVSHGGGCSNHYYQLFWNPDVFAESLPPQADLYLRHFNNRDFCRALLSKRPMFDLTPIKEAYFNYYGDADSATVLLNIHDYFDGSTTDIQLPYHFTP